MKLLGLLIVRPRPLVREAVEVVEHGSACGQCGAWRCPRCGYLILDWRDHAAGCPRGRVPS